MKNLLIILSLLLASSCKTVQPSIERIYKDSTIIKEVPVLVEVPGAVIQSPTINIDSLVNLIKAGVKPDVINNTLVKEDPETKLRVGILLDELGNLSALCEQQDKTIEILTNEITHWKERYEQTTIIEPLPWWKKPLEGLKMLGLLALAFLVILIFVRR